MGPWCPNPPSPAATNTPPNSGLRRTSRAPHIPRRRSVPADVPGRLFFWVKLASWFELCLFARCSSSGSRPATRSRPPSSASCTASATSRLCLLIFARDRAPPGALAAPRGDAHPARTGGQRDRIELIERRGWGIGRDRPPNGESHRLLTAPKRWIINSGREDVLNLKDSSPGQSRLRGRSRRKSLPGYRRAGVARAVWTPCLPRPRHATALSGLRTVA